ncbi:MAG TPA: DUF411 domain-containing protein [Sphingomicrobium sp.]|nr:DUF411 domain-containing protein [Sphingomicrobium sp.]
MAFAGLAALAVGACKRSPSEMNVASAVATDTPAAPRPAAMTVYRDPSCGCCEAWARMAERAGFQVTLVDRGDMPAIKQRLGVPEALASCHTAIIGDYVIEGHVPLDAVRRLVSGKPAGIRGIAVAGMPRGTPGMEMPDGSKDPFEIIAFNGAGTMTAFQG